MKRSNLTYVRELQEVLTDDLTYTDGHSFEIGNPDSNLGAVKLLGPCFALASNEGWELRDYKCSSEVGAICMWKGKRFSVDSCTTQFETIKTYQKIENRSIQFLQIGPYCPSGYKHLGQHSDGRVSVGDTGSDNRTGTVISSFHGATCYSESDLLRERWTPNSPEYIETYQTIYP